MQSKELTIKTMTVLLLTVYSRMKCFFRNLKTKATFFTAHTCVDL